MGVRYWLWMGLVIGFKDTGARNALRFGGIAVLEIEGREIRERGGSLRGRAKVPDHDIAVVCCCQHCSSSQAQEHNSPDPETIMSSDSWRLVTAPLCPTSVCTQWPDW